MSSVVVIPAYKPDNDLIKLTNELVDEHFDVLVVNDGSGKEFDGIFEEVSKTAKVIANETNMGKGCALKHGFSMVRELFPECTNLITADADGQHLVSDIKRVSYELEKGADFVLTVRRRRQKVPFRSRFGNDLSKLVYTILTGHYFQDNQSGLRGFSVDNIDWLLKVGGDKYDYEMNMLFYADKQAIPITTITIDAIYFDGNKSSHFSPLKDTALIYKTLFSSAWASVATLLFIESCMVFTSIVFKYNLFYINVPSIGIASSFICMTVYRFGIFRDFKYNDGLRTIVYSILRYTIYTLGVLIFHLVVPGMPLFVAFNLIVVLAIAPEYYMHKGIHAASYKDVNKEHKTA